MPLEAEMPMTQEYQVKGNERTEIYADGNVWQMTIQGENLKSLIEAAILNSPEIGLTKFKKERPIFQIESQYGRTVLHNNIEIENDNFFASFEINSINLLNNSFNNEIKRIKNKQGIALKEITATYYSMREFLYKLPIENCAIEVSLNNKIKFTLSFSDERLLMISKTLNDNLNGYAKGSIMYSYFINQKLIASDVTNFEVFANSFKEYIFM